MTHGNKTLQEQRRAERRGCCDGKIGYSTPEKAELGRRKSMRLYKSKLRAYPCPHCGLWHLGH